MIDALREPLAFAFFRHALVAATTVGGLCGLMGVFIVLRRMSYIGHGLSHSVFGGAVVSAVFSWNVFIGAGLWGFLSALLIEATARRRHIGADAAIGIISTASFALGVAIISRSGSFGRDFEAALFGNILGVTVSDLAAIGAVAAVVALAVGIAYPHLVFTTFDAPMRVFTDPLTGERVVSDATGHWDAAWRGERPRPEGPSGASPEPIPWPTAATRRRLVAR